jgi:DNA polymerase alpha subunit A
VHTAYEPTQFQKFWTQLSDAERFKTAHPWSCYCPECKKTFSFDGVFRDAKDSLELALICPNKDCKKAVDVHSISAQLTTAIRQDIEKYYEG